MPNTALTLTASATLAVFLALPTPALAQEQQAGNAASTNAEQTFQQLIAKCDNTDMLMLRARIRLLLGRTTEAASKEAQAMLDDGLSKCGAGNLDEAKATLDQALKVASAGVEQKLADDASAQAAQASQNAQSESGSESGSAKPASADGGEKKPWWKFW